MKPFSKSTSACLGDPAGEPSLYTPSVLLRRIADAIQLNPQGSPLYLRGIFEEKYDKNYNGFYYAYLRDPAGDKRFTLHLPADLYAQCQPGQTIVVRGYIQARWEKDDAAEILLRVDSLDIPAFLLPQHDAAATDQQTRLALLTEQARRRRLALADLLLPKLHRGEKPILKCIYGRTNEVEADVMSALQDAAAAYTLLDERINITAKADLLHALAQVENSTAYDAVIIIRGGGAALDLLDDLDIARAALRLKPHLATAVGHAAHTPLLEQMADTAFATPTALGQALRTYVDLARPQLASAPPPFPPTDELVQRLSAALLPSLQPPPPQPPPISPRALPSFPPTPSAQSGASVTRPTKPLVIPAPFALLQQAIPAHFRLQSITTPASRPALARLASLLVLLTSLSPSQFR